jgi:pimeloyl-ACP methyl ester carboxylesterase
MNGVPMLAATLAIAAVVLGGCSQSTAAPEIPVAPVPAEDPAPAPPPAPAPSPPGAQPRLAAEPAQIADDLVADELALRNPSTPEPALVAAARRQQAAYRAIGRNPNWDAIARERIPADLLFAYDRNLVSDELAKLRYEASIQPGFQESYSQMFPAPRQRWVDAMASPEHAIKALPHDTLVIHGREDRIIPPGNSYTLSDWIPRSQLHIFGQCGHWTQIEHAKRFANLLNNFFTD